jgi:outer membrane protein assembly factor BamB
MGYRLGVDLGTTYTAAAVWRNGAVDPVKLGEYDAQAPTVACVAADGSLLFGDVADERGARDPAASAREFKRRIGDPVPMLLAGRPFSPQALMSRLLRWVVDRTVVREGGSPELITLTHPANWGDYKLDLLAQAVRLSDLGVPVGSRSEPEACALYFSTTEQVADGETVAVYDLGGGTFDAAAVRRCGDAFETLGAPEGIEHLGGVDFDQAVLAAVLNAAGFLADSDTADDLEATRALNVLRRRCVEAKEFLSTNVTTTILVPTQLGGGDIRFSRGEFEDLIRPALEDTLGAMRRALRDAGVAADELRAIVLAGGSSRIPLVRHLVESSFGRPVAPLPEPSHAAAIGAALAPPQRWLAAPAVARSDAAVGQVAVIDAAPEPSGSTGGQLTPPAGGGRNRLRWLVPVALAGLLVVAVAWVLRPRDTPAPTPVADQPRAHWLLHVGSRMASSVAFDGNRGYFGAHNGNVYAVDVLAKRVLWTFHTGNEVFSSPALSNGTIYVGSDDKHLYALDARTGGKRWSRAFGQAVQSSPTVDGGRVFVGSDDGTLRAFTTAGKPVWTMRTKRKLNSSPTAYQGRVLVGGTDGNLYSVDEATGREKHYAICSQGIYYSRPAMWNGVAYIGCNSGVISGVNLSTGASSFTFNTDGKVSGSPAIVDGVLYVGSFDGNVYAVNVQTQGEVWRFPVGQPVFSSPRVVGDTVYFGTHSHRIYAVDRLTGRERWHVDTGAIVGSSPGLARGLLSVGSDDGVFYVLNVSTDGAH